jgi:hypothetical protein
MKKGIIFFAYVLLPVLALSTCASVNSQGINYFVGRSETDLINHFGYNGKEINSSDSEYDKVLFFTNKILKYRMSKTEYVRYKVTKQSEILDVSFNQYSDGCLTFIDSVYLGQHYVIEEISQNSRVIHRNDNSSLRPIINNFNNIINRSDAFPNSQRNSVFDRSRIGDTYYLYNNTSKQNWSSGVMGLTQAESYTSFLYVVWKIDVVAEDRPETKAFIVAIYDERFDRWLSGNGNSTLTQERANSIVNEYINNGFTRRVVTEGHSMYAYIKNGKIIKVEEENG